MAKQIIDFEKTIRNVETALNLLDACMSTIANEKKELNCMLAVIKEAQGDVGARPKVSKKIEIKPLSKEKQAEVLAGFFKNKKAPAKRSLKQN